MSCSIWGGEDKGQRYANIHTTSAARGSNKISFGYYQINNVRRVAKVTYVPEHLLQQPSFTFDDTFDALGISVPNLIFEVNGSQDPTEWNTRLPSYKKGLIGVIHFISFL